MCFGPNMRKRTILTRRRTQVNSIRPIWTIHLITLVILVLWSTTDPSFVTMVRLRSFSDALLIVGWVRVAALTAATGVSYAAALRSSGNYLLNHPDEQGTIQIVPLEEISHG